jgi:hypothetical protein
VLYIYIYIYNAVDGRRVAEVGGNVGSEHECVNNECETEDGNCEDTETETDDRNGEHSETSEAE